MTHLFRHLQAEPSAQGPSDCSIRHSGWQAAGQGHPAGFLPDRTAPSICRQGTAGGSLLGRQGLGCPSARMACWVSSIRLGWVHLISGTQGGCGCLNQGAGQGPHCPFWPKISGTTPWVHPGRDGPREAWEGLKGRSALLFGWCGEARSGTGDLAGRHLTLAGCC